MGFVYLARDPKLGRSVAIKTVRDQGLDEEARKRFLERFHNEARAAAALHHPFIVQIYDVGEDEAAGPYLVFEYVEGSTLKELIAREGALSPSVVVRLADQVANALKAAHQAGILHRDIKPDNLLMTPEGATKLADFGVARVPNAALTKEGQFLGTPCYAAPETLKLGPYTPQSDVFSFAAVLYEAVSGARAFPGTDALAVAHNVIHDQPLPPSKIAKSARVPLGVDNALMRSLSKDPKARHETAMSLARELRSAYSEAKLLDEAEAPTYPNDGHVFADKPPQSVPLREFFWWASAGATLLFGIFAVLHFNQAHTPDTETLSTHKPTLPLGRENKKPVPEAIELVRDATVNEKPGAVSEPAQDPTEENMTAHEREEAAKDALSLARSLLEQGKIEEARAQLAAAERWDRFNPDIARLRDQLASATAPNP